LENMDQNFVFEVWHNMKNQRILNLNLLQELQTSISSLLKLVGFDIYYTWMLFCWTIVLPHGWTDVGGNFYLKKW